MKQPYLTSTFHRRRLVVALIAIVGLPFSVQATSSSQLSEAAKVQVQQHYGQLPLSFEVNQGQTDSQVKFLARGHGYGLFLTPTEAVLSLQTSPAKNPSTTLGGAASETIGTVFRMQWIGGRSSPPVVGRKGTTARVNYLIGKNPAHWHTGVPTYAQVAYEGVYPGVDLVYYGNQGQLEYDVVVAPKADPRSIRLAFQGADRMEVNAAGELVLHSGNREIQMHKPIIYQEVAGVRKFIAGSYSLNAAREVGFEVSAYDRSQPLVIDPTLAYSSYLGGNDSDVGDSIAVDSTGHAYVSGTTRSANFPTTAGVFQPAFTPGLGDAFVAKLNPTGTALDYATYLGGSSYDLSYGIAVDGSGHAYVTGQATSADFPTTAGAFQSANPGVGAFVAKLNPTGSGLDYSTILGGSRYDVGGDIAIDSTGHAYVTGETQSADFPTTPGVFKPAFDGDLYTTYTFVAKLNPTGSGLDYATYLSLIPGGGFNESIAVDGTGHAYVTGETGPLTFPATAGAFQPASGGGVDAFVAKLNPTGTALDYATFLGGNDLDISNGIAVDSTGHAYVTGGTYSVDFPTTAGAFQSTYPGGVVKAFVAKLNPTGNALDYATYLGGNQADFGNGIAVDSTGHAYVTGGAGSANFPITADAFQSVIGGIFDAFVAKLNPTGTALDYATFLGGNVEEIGNGIAVDSTGHAYVTGNTVSDNFPTTAGAFQSAYAGSSDAFVAKLDIPVSLPKVDDFMTFVVEGGQVCQYRRVNDPATYDGQWHKTGECFGTNVLSNPSVIKSSYGNLEAVVQEGNQFCHYYQINATGIWYRTECGGQNVASAPSLIQSTFIGNNGIHGNFEVVVQEGTQFCHYYRDNTNYDGSWYFTACGGQNVASAPSLVQSSYISDNGKHGNFEVVVQEGNEFCHYWRDNTNYNGNWYFTACGGQNVALAPSLIQSTYIGDNGTHGNFEVVVKEGDEFCHYWRDNTNYNGNWYFTACGGQNVASAPSLIQSTYIGDNGTHGNFEVVVQKGNEFCHYWRDNTNYNGNWNFTACGGQNVTSAPVLLQIHQAPTTNYYVSCKEIHDMFPAVADGIYTIEPVPNAPIQVHCLMSRDGGGWTLVANFPWPGNTNGIMGWTSGGQVNASFTDLAQAFKLSDSSINTLKTVAYRAHGSADMCVQGPCSIDTTLYWKASCQYLSGSLGTTCGDAYLDPALTIRVSNVSDTSACPWHWGLVASNCGLESEMGTSHEGDHVFVGTIGSYIHAFDGRTGENPSIQVWVK